MIPYSIHQTVYFVEVLIEGLFFFEMLSLDVWVIEQLPNNASSKSDVLTSNLHRVLTTLYGNFEKVKLLLEITNHRFTAIGISETWLNETTLDLVEISGYNFIFNHSINKSGG